MGNGTHINARCDAEKKQQYLQLAEAMGYSNFSEFLLTVLDALNDSYQSEGWESHLVHLNGPRIVAADAHELKDMALATAAFPVVAPARFWNHLEEHCVSDDDRA